MTVASWIWIAGSIVIATIIIVLSMSMMLSFQDRNQKIFSIEAYDNLVDRASIICSQSKGNIDYYRISLPDIVRAVYPANYINELPPDKVSINITNLDNGKGKYICLQFFDETTSRCSNINCEVEMTYVGSPTLQNNLADILAKTTGKYPVYGYILMINKTETKKIRITAERELKI